MVCQAVEKQLDLLSDKEILDFGGGTGLLALPLAKQAKSVTLVDISEKMLEQARLKAERQDIKNIQFLEQEFDLIVVCRVLHHMPNLDAALSLFHQHLRENGQLLLADFTMTEDNHHGFDLTDTLRKSLQTTSALPCRIYVTDFVSSICNLKVVL